ncbi:helix-turn-helix transcriptional regulator [Paraburkholderia heleia]|uniref:helix-turn-helix transcriptional regulator n=1 Tax=Paraburkholderia heleia TaxID=634127 RepID=UPI002AB7E1C9|nr:helix-turn-helix domain-containing protein [Paraburkholderia heleia]
MSTVLPKLHRINAAAAALGVSRNTIYRFAKMGKLTRVQIGENSSGITDESLRALMVSGLVAPMVADDETPTMDRDQVVEKQGKIYHS